MDENTRKGSGLTKYLWLLPALVVLLLIARAAISLSGSATDGATWDADGQVLEVDEGGPAAQAGLRVGDTVLSAGNCDTATWDVCQYNAYRPGSVVPITFQQGEQVHAASLTLTMTPAGTRLAWLMVLLVALAFCLCSLVVVMSRPDATEARLFYALGQVGAASLVMGTLSSAEMSTMSRWFGVFNGLLTPVMVHFHAVFPERHWLARQRWLLRMLYGTGVVLAVLRWARPIFSYPVHMIQNLLYLWLFLGFVAAIGLMVFAYLTTRSPYTRRWIRLVVFGTLLGYGPVGLLTVAPMALLGSAGWGSGLWRFTIPLLGLVPITYAVALWRYNLMNFDRALNRGLVYLVVSLVLFGLYLSVLAIFPVVLPANLAGRAVLLAALALLAAITFQPLQSRAQRLVDRLFYGGWYDYRGLVEEVGHTLACTVDPQVLVQVLVHRVPQAMHLPGAALWLEQEGKMEIVGTSGAQVPDTRIWPGGSKVADQAEVTMAHDHAAVPLAVEDRVVGTWVLAARPSGEWGPEDRRILTALSRQAALVAQNARLVAELRAKVTQVEEMHRRLVAAREEERADLAQKLYSGVIRDLGLLRYRLVPGKQGDQAGPAADGYIREEIHTQAGLLVDKLRRLCSDLRPLALDQLGLPAALRLLAQEMTVQGLPVETYVEDLSLLDEAATGLYRICQEALSNAWRHAQASRAIVTLACEENEVVLTIADDGQGFDPASLIPRDRSRPGGSTGGRFGLAGMAELAQGLGGLMTIQSAPGQGTQVVVRCGLYVLSP